MPALDEISLLAGRLNAADLDYMITGATAAILYGQPRLTNDLDVVVALRDEQVAALISAFPEAEFYTPPESDIRAVLATTDVDQVVVGAWVERLGLAQQWAEVQKRPA